MERKHNEFLFDKFEEEKEEKKMSFLRTRVNCQLRSFTEIYSVKMGIKESTKKEKKNQPKYQNTL